MRPFLVKEQKILYMALESKDEREIANAVIRILESCIITNDINIRKLPSFDVEYLFLKLRGSSVGEIINVKLGHVDSECKHMTEMAININDIKITEIKDRSDKITLNETTGMTLRYPNLQDTLKSSNDMSETDKLFHLVQSCIENIYDAENVYENIDQNELREFIESMSVEQFKMVMDYFGDIPTIEFETKWHCKECKKDDSIIIKGLRNFFG
jgi:hypothetical protein